MRGRLDKMKKTHVLGLAIFAVFAFSVVLASSASAVEVPQWLVSSGVITLATELVDADLLPETELLLLEDMSNGADVLCEISKSLGWLLPNGLGEIVEGECINTEAMAVCEASPLPTVKPLHLPWTTELLEPTAGNFELDITAGTGGPPGWETECNVFLLGKIKDSCTTNNGKVLLENLADGLVRAEFMETIEKTEQANCEANKEVGLVVGLALIHALNSLEELLTLAVSLAPEEV